MALLAKGRGWGGEGKVGVKKKVCEFLMMQSIQGLGGHLEQAILYMT